MISFCLTCKARLLMSRHNRASRETPMEFRTALALSSLSLSSLSLYPLSLSLYPLSLFILSLSLSSLSLFLSHTLSLSLSYLSLLSLFSLSPSLSLLSLFSVSILSLSPTLPLTDPSPNVDLPTLQALLSILFCEENLKKSQNAKVLKSNVNTFY